MKAGNFSYRSGRDIDSVIPVFPLSAALLLPGGRLPLNIFEPRYLAMTDHALSGGRLIGMVQPRLDGATRPDGEPALCDVGCVGRLGSVSETGDGRYLITLIGICRFRLLEELSVKTPFRQCRILPFESDLHDDPEEPEVDRAALLRAFRAYLEANDLEADWDSVHQAEDASLVNALSMMVPYGPAEKQALLEAPDLKTRADTLIAITEIVLAQGEGDATHRLQ
ncbi:LON peptidase substrate-binding domain-containing protein [Nitratireductor aquimarinus]|uniref:LON peptidase substrate-binding domain-containing protein n=1 Tax=Nitratireductor aquimarinus TaxID=889300 RepID=A0ABU4AQD5_9HYPH|nr:MULTISPECIES: LON peptidase substrate-binding domain-containing protein [Alphaproteobacteria]MBN7762246.1 LON peptidase substrate-binding domain-containing protein [Nitratireductor aquibiodomus]MBN7778032.1 LON peptidase substrate-binding domain-containing protein [Nitratireductor pacificus]MBY6022572.1 LON peptidase substrate-binding domain-containing protein [Nitratireductor sp. DP7N14-4]MBN7757781.1 LON peptidase substrate-binding domain-containing protein [Nitratireductor aquimarinus]MB